MTNFNKPIHEYYDTGLGCVVRGATHRKQLMKERGLIEVGNERNHMIKMRKEEIRKQEEGITRDIVLKQQALKELSR